LGGWLFIFRRLIWLVTGFSSGTGRSDSIISRLSLRALSTSFIGC
jgi:hypothetical protein